MVALSGAHAWYRLRQEHGEWAVRTVSLDTADRRPNPVTYGWAANWAFIGGDHDLAIVYAGQGIDRAPASEHPSTAGCWAALTWANIASGRGSEARQPARSAQIAAARNPDVHTQAWAHVAIIEDAFVADIASAADHVNRYARWADKVGATALLAGAAFYQGQVKLAAEHSPDAQGVLSLYRDGLDLARKAGDINNEGKNVLGLAIAAARFRTPEASAVCREALTRLYDTRHWPLFWIGVDVVARWLGSGGKLEDAAVLYGHLEVHHPVWDNPAGRRGRSRGLAIVREHPRADPLMARGAAMGREELVAFVLDQLVQSEKR